MTAERTAPDGRTYVACDHPNTTRPGRCRLAVGACTHHQEPNITDEPSFHESPLGGWPTAQRKILTLGRFRELTARLDDDTHIAIDDGDSWTNNVSWLGLPEREPGSGGHLSIVMGPGEPVDTRQWGWHEPGSVHDRLAVLVQRKLAILDRLIATLYVAAGDVVTAEAPGATHIRCSAEVTQYGRTELRLVEVHDSDGLVSHDEHEHDRSQADGEAFDRLYEALVSYCYLDDVAEYHAAGGLDGFDGDSMDKLHQFSLDEAGVLVWDGLVNPNVDCAGCGQRIYIGAGGKTECGGEGEGICTVLANEQDTIVAGPTGPATASHQAAATGRNPKED